MSTILELKLPLLTLAMLPGAAQLDTTHVDESRPVLKSSSNVGVEATGGGPLRTLLWFWAGIPIANKTDKSATISLFIIPPPQNFHSVQFPSQFIPLNRHATDSTEQAKLKEWTGWAARQADRLDRLTAGGPTAVPPRKDRIFLDVVDQTL
jgi:hypothetical protein